MSSRHLEHRPASPASPQRTRRLLIAIVRDPDGRTLVDDLDELFADDIKGGVLPRVARRRYRKEAVTLAVRWLLHRSSCSRAPGENGNRRWSFDVARQLRLAARRLRREPLFATTVIVTLALGIAGNAVVLSLISALWLDPLPFPMAERLVYVWSVGERSDRTAVSYPNIEDIRARAASFDVLTGFVTVGLGLSLEGGARRVDVGTVDAEFFEVLGIEPLLGRVLGPGDSGPDAPDVVVISESLWRSGLGADLDVVGKTVRIEGALHEVVGVARPPAGVGAGLAPLTDWDLWWPPHNLRSAGIRRFASYALLGRLATGVTAEQAGAELAMLSTALAAEHPSDNRDLSLRALSLRDDMFGPLAPALRLLLAGSVLVLVVAAINVANLLAVRAHESRGATWLRRALGASTGHLLAHALAEVGVLLLLGAAVGLGLATLSLDALMARFPAPRRTSRSSGCKSIPNRRSPPPRSRRRPRARLK